jgi:hypothetical protein
VGEDLGKLGEERRILRGENRELRHVVGQPLRPVENLKRRESKAHLPQDGIYQVIISREFTTLELLSPIITFISFAAIAYVILSNAGEGGE